MEVAKRSYGVDVSSFQGTDLSQYANLGAKFAIVKLSEGLNYQNPKAQAQISSAKANGMLTMGYHYARFGADSILGGQEGKYTVQAAKSFGLPDGSYLACDWETGSGNVTDGSSEANTNAILTFLNTIVAAGYKPLLYSGKALLTNNVNVEKITAKHGTCLWVASYKPMEPQNTADFGWFPSMDNVAIWQFTSNWHGVDVDGNISLINLKTTTTSALQPSKSVKSGPSNEKTWTDVQGMTWHAEEGTFITGGAINLRWGATTQSMIITQLPAGSVVKYNAWARDSSGRVWLQQPRGSNHYGYLVGRVGNDAWGTFK